MSSNIHKLLRRAYDLQASDLHISVGSPPIYRVDGKLQNDGKEGLTEKETERMAKEILNSHWEEFKQWGEYDFAYSLDQFLRFRINVFRQKRTISIAARVIRTKIPTVEDLRLPATLNKLVSQPHGLIIVTGPTGSGKSSTLAAMIAYVNETMRKHIITFEDPIEFIHEHKQSIIQQREVGIDTKEFSTGLRAALRQDPDILLVGEMRDLETISTAITAAETGHLVLATLHTNSSVQTIHRIIDVFPPHQQRQIRIQLASVLKAVISQRLFPRADGPGRIPATEILIGNPAIANLIRSEKIDQIYNVLQTSRAQGMHTLENSIQELLEAGKIHNEDAQLYLGNVGDK